MWISPHLTDYDTNWLAKRNPPTAYIVTLVERVNTREALASHAFQVIDADGDGLATLGSLEDRNDHLNGINTYTGTPSKFNIDTLQIVRFLDHQQ